MKRFDKNGILLADNSSNQVIEDSAAMLLSAGFADDLISQFADEAVSILNDYAQLVGEGTQIRYTIAKRFARIELDVLIPGDSYNPFESGRGARNRRLKNLISLNMNTETTNVSHKYVLGYNVLSVSIPLAEKKKVLFRDPMILAIVSGVLFGLLCQRLPETANSFIVDELASPVLSIILRILAGIMGPVVFISMITAIIALDSISDLTNLGFRIILRFIWITLFLTAVSITVSAFFFRSFGTQSITFAPAQLLQMVFDMIPTNLFAPFLENNTPQLVILGLLLGSALLLLGDRVSKLNEILLQINEWMMSAMRIVLMVTPAIPFLSIFTSTARGNADALLKGWKFVAASYIAYTLAVACKAAKASVKTSVSIPEFWRRIRPVVMMALKTGSTAAPVRKVYEISEKDFHIKPEFTSFWIPMCSAMLSPKTTINVVIATFMAAEMSGMAVTASFLTVLVIMTLELSVASPGTTSAWTVMFAALSMPTAYVGLFSAYRVLTANYESACTEAYDMFEEVEAAHAMNGINRISVTDV